MEDIELVIKINKHIANAIITGENDEPRSIVRGFQATIADAIKNGTPLPKGHGDLIDRSKIYKAIPAEDDNCTGMGMTYDEMYEYNNGIDAMYSFIQDARPIIKADESEKTNET